MHMKKAMITTENWQVEFDKEFLADGVGQDDNGKLYDLFAGTKTVGNIKPLSPPSSPPKIER